MDGYCVSCRKKLFGGRKVSHVLNFDPPKENNYREYQHLTKKLSISGVQLKYSLILDGTVLKLTESAGQYILKPVPNADHILNKDQAPENEHLTMQIAAQLFGMDTADNALIFFKDGSPAYLTRRFDIKPTGGKYLQEDMAQASGRTRQGQGENFKYDGTYEEVGALITRYAAAPVPALEAFFKQVLFNYIFSNDDAHLKNFSFIESPMGDNILSSAYDLMCTELHTPGGVETALGLYKGDTDNEFYAREGRYGQVHFRELAKRMGIQPVRANRIIATLLAEKSAVHQMVEKSFLSAAAKQQYLSYYDSKVRLLGTNERLIADQFRKSTFPPDVMVRVFFYRGKQPIVGKIIHTLADDPASVTNNHFAFVEEVNLKEYNQTGDASLVTVIDADTVVEVREVG
ncbi:serine/threonine-protein kinase HipA [Chitinophaga jiangningensis]|uniref:Serine/threonine-protein kinase HipA n=1 Tax=Chitinophaga jiangningensis TaxID=1419482 RepID=A0A1M6VPW8_9BACT|nr:HipA domain-containing protein [Chitinophaga jiangningensis]SHK83597.1 serine/threonine-protein kinase HipA [Chitinophaga jiangningensis]